jgi:tetratricopeptide (TPR) repeat protein
MYKLTGELAKDYKIYLDERNDYLNLPAFYFDIANWFYAHGDKETALRILTSIADLELENAPLYRMLSYRLKEYGEYALEKFVCQKVIQWRPADPQSYRDYALALADNGETQAALDSLYSLLRKKYPENTDIRNPKIDEVLITEINHLIAKNANLNKSKIPKRLLINIPVDVRVVINWNTDSTDVDMQVKDPNNEWCYANRRQTGIGGRISADIRDGYGPEQFLLKNAVKGKYRVYVNYYGDRIRYYYHPDQRVAATEPTTVMAEIYTKYADKTEQRRIVCLQFSKAREIDGGNVLLDEFEIE